MRWLLRQTRPQGLIVRDPEGQKPDTGWRLQAHCLLSVPALLLRIRSINQPASSRSCQTLWFWSRHPIRTFVKWYWNPKMDVIGIATSDLSRRPCCHSGRM